MGFYGVERGGLRFLRCEALDRVPGAAHAFSTRRGPEGEFDFALDAPGSDCARRALCEAAGLGARLPHEARQVHGAVVIRVECGAAPAVVPGADGLVASRAARPTAGLAVRSADCVPLLLAEVGGAALAAVHAGWRGAAAGIVGAAVRTLVDLGARPEALVVALGPSIGGCCYTVGEDVVVAVARASGTGPQRLGREEGGGFRLDLGAALALQLEAAGVAPAAIYRSRACTACHRGLFFSHRRDGGRSGRQLSCIGWVAPPVA